MLERRWAELQQMSDIWDSYFPPLNLHNYHMSNALEKQVGGGHYKDKPIQPVEYISANKMNFLEGCVIKRITRWRDKNGIEDLEKAKHEIDLLITMEKKYNE